MECITNDAIPALQVGEQTRFFLIQEICSDSTALCISVFIIGYNLR